MSHRLREALLRTLLQDMQFAEAPPELEDSITPIPIRLVMAGMA
jgi:hypothetical protein